MNLQQRNALFERLTAVIPEPKTELRYSSVFELLIAVVLSAQATDKSVNKATAALFSVANTPEAILALGETRLKSFIQSIGLCNTKARNIELLCAKLVANYQSQVPQTREALQSLPGVGRKTANVILNTAFGQPTIAVDTHIFRLANRTGLAPGRTVLEVERQLEQRIPTQYKLAAHHLLILHGRYTCMAKKPRCTHCVLHDLCAYPDKF